MRGPGRPFQGPENPTGQGRISPTPHPRQRITLRTHPATTDPGGGPSRIAPPGRPDAGWGGSGGGRPQGEEGVMGPVLEVLLLRLLVWVGVPLLLIAIGIGPSRTWRIFRRVWAWVDD